MSVIKKEHNTTQNHKLYLAEIAEFRRSAVNGLHWRV